MKYISTRGAAPPRGFIDILLAGTASDGGLFMPEAWPRLRREEIAGFRSRAYCDIARDILARFAEDNFSVDELTEDIEAAYATFDCPEIVPLVALGHERYLLELFHGPTLAFKDVALQLMAHLFARSLKRRGARATIVVATSGDTGGAAVEAFGGMTGVELFVLHPAGRVSEMQRRQMTTSPHANIHNIAIRGTFDEAQAIVKGLFADRELVDGLRLASVNSINLVRILIQSVYYFSAAAALPSAPVFVVPTGNFGDVFAGEVATRMGLPVQRLIVATNANDIMVRTLNDGVYAAGRAVSTLSPAMDIQVASNFERALFEAADRDGDFVRRNLSPSKDNHELQLPPAVLGRLQARYAANCATDGETVGSIRRFKEETGRTIDPHTAVAAAAAIKYGGAAGTPVVILSTAHPAKFPEAIERALGAKPALPERLSELLALPEKVVEMDAKLPLVRAFIEARLAHHES